MKDKRTEEYLKVWGSQNMPTACVTEGSIRVGLYPTFVLLGWVEPHHLGPIVALRLAILSKTMNNSIGGMVLSLPCNSMTERHVCSLLQDFGWDGRVWPYKDHGWPEGTPNEEQLLALLKKANLGATLTFPSTDEGTPVYHMPVKKKKDSYMVAPFGNIVPKHLDMLRELTNNPAPFKSDWKDD